MSTLPQNGHGRPTTNRNRSALGNRLGRAVRWIDDWTVEAFNPVYPPHRAGRR